MLPALAEVTRVRWLPDYLCHAQTIEFHDNRLHLQCDAAHVSELLGVK